METSSLTSQIKAVESFGCSGSVKVDKQTKCWAHLGTSRPKCCPSTLERLLIFICKACWGSIGISGWHSHERVASPLWRYVSDKKSFCQEKSGGTGFIHSSSSSTPHNLYISIQPSALPHFLSCLSSHPLSFSSSPTPNYPTVLHVCFSL